MIKSTLNQLGNCLNPHQGKAKKVLCVCSAGLLRSPTMASVLEQSYGYNTRSCGTAVNFALIPISEVLVKWADEIVFAHLGNWEEVMHHEAFIGKKVVVLNVPDMYTFGNPILKEIISEQYVNSNGFIVGEE